MNDKSLGGSWADDDFDVNSIEIPLDEPPRRQPFNRGPGGFNMGQRGSGYNNYDNEMSGGSSYGREFGARDTHYGRFDDHDRSYNRRNSGPRLSDLPSIPIAKLSNLPEVSTQKLVANLFESRFMKFEKVKVLVDPNPPQPRFSKFHHEEEQKKKCAYVQLNSPQDLLKVLKWTDIFLERLRVEVSVADFDDFQDVQKYNKEIGFDESAEEERLNKKLEEEVKKANNWRQEVKYGNTSDSRGAFGGRRYANERRYSGNAGGEGMDASKCPYLAGRGFKGSIAGMKAPHPLPATGDGSAVNAEHVRHPKEQASKNVESKPEILQKVGASKSKSKAKKENPFGIAKPVDPKKQMEIEKKIEKMSINSTTFSTEKLNKHIKHAKIEDDGKMTQRSGKAKDIKKGEAHVEQGERRTRRVSIIRRESNAKAVPDSAPKVVSRKVAVNGSKSVQLQRSSNVERSRKSGSLRKASPVKEVQQTEQTEHRNKNSTEKDNVSDASLKSRKGHSSYHKGSRSSVKDKKMSSPTTTGPGRNAKTRIEEKNIDGSKQAVSKKKRLSRDAARKRRHKEKQIRISQQIKSGKSAGRGSSVVKASSLDTSRKVKPSESAKLQGRCNSEQMKSKGGKNDKKISKKENVQKKVRNDSHAGSFKNDGNVKNERREANNSKRHSLEHRGRGSRGRRESGRRGLKWEKYHKNYTYVRDSSKEESKQPDTKKKNDKAVKDVQEKVIEKSNSKSDSKSNSKSEAKPEAKPERKSEKKPETTTETKPETRSETFETNKKA